MNNKVVIIAPGHDDADHRVLRSLRKILKIKQDSVLFLEASRLKSDFKDSAAIKSYSAISFIDLLLLKDDLFEKSLANHLLDTNHVCVHDSGLYGIVLIRYIDKRFPGKSIIFDYHDFLDWEILHHISKFIRGYILQKFLIYIVTKLVDILILKKLKLNSLVGISHGQVNQLKARIGNECKTSFIVPNTRAKLGSSFNGGDTDNSWKFLWVGNIGNNRSIEKMNQYKKALENKFKNKTVENLFIGKPWGLSADQLKDKNILGSYQTDSDIMELIPKSKTIGVFFGWSDEFMLGINEIGSPNKVYTYINLGIPFLIPKELKNIILECNVDSCFVYDGQEQFINRANNLFNNYTFYCSKVRDLKKIIRWEESVGQSLYLHYKEVLK